MNETNSWWLTLTRWLKRVTAKRDHTHYKDADRRFAEMKVGLDWYEFLCFGSPTALSCSRIIPYHATGLCKGPIAKNWYNIKLVNSAMIRAYLITCVLKITLSFVNETKPFHKFNVKNVSIWKQYWHRQKSLLKHIWRSYPLYWTKGLELNIITKIGRVCYFLCVILP